MINLVTFNNFRGLDELNLPLSQITMLTGVNCIGKTSVLEGLYCLFSETRLDVSPLSRYNRTIGFIINQGVNAPMGFAARHGYNYKLFWNECPTYEQNECSVKAKADDNLIWSWTYKKASFADIDKLMTINSPVPVDSSTEFALWNWSCGGTRINKTNHQKEIINNKKIIRAQILAPDGGLYLLPPTAQTSSICRYLDFSSIRSMPQKLSFSMSRLLTEALQIINPRVTDVRLTDISSGLSVVLDDKYSVTLGTIGNGAVTWASALIAIFEVIESFNDKTPSDVPIIILIDEIGAGIHYSVMLAIWEYLKNFAQKYPNLQFVTTSHSDDCVHAFCEAFSDENSASIVRLHRTKIENKIIPTPYLKEHFKHIASGDWEVRG
ncbi:hypothetical protein AGMMS50268_14970 [Spirochaetia bacterium]|nr:hypothetical protein AGMMS50268_14970 [Spirochaetia bacterium]